MDPVVRSDLTDRQVTQLRALYTGAERCPTRDDTALREALAGTDELVALVDAGSEDLLAAACVFTDYESYARVYEVVVAADRRREGLGRRLLRAVVDHPALSAVDHVSLDCRESLVPFYERCGFARHDVTVVDDATDCDETTDRDGATEPACGASPGDADGADDEPVQTMVFHRGESPDVAVGRGGVGDD